MKTILPLVSLLLLVSCSHPPPPQFAPFGPASRHEVPPAVSKPPVAAQAANAPSVKPPGPSLAATNLAGKNLPAPSALPSRPELPEAVPTLTNTPTAAATMLTNEPARTAQSAEDIIPAGTINFPATDLNQVLQIYSELVNRTVLRPANLGAPLITLKTQTPLTKSEAIQAFDAVLAMNGITMINVGDKFVKAVPTAQANQEGAAFNRLDSGQLPELGQYVTHVLQLKYTKPSELIPVLQPFAKIPNSILAIDSSQILVLRDYTENVKRMLEMVKEIDVSVPSEYVSEVIPIKYAKADDIQAALNSLTGGGGGAGGTSVGRSSGGAARSAGGGLARPGGGLGTGVGGGAYPQAGAIGGQGGIGGVPGQAGAPAGGSFTDRLRNIIQKASASGELQILGQTKIIADERSNALLIFATKQDMDMIKNIVSKLDVVLAQVLIETVILDVQMNSGWDFGVSGAQTTTPYNSHSPASGYQAGAANNGQQFLDLINGAATNAFSLSSLPGGFSYWGLIGKNFNLALQAAASDSRVNVIQRPQILTTHATPASIFIGNTVPYITSSYYGGGYGGGPSSSYQQLSVGIGLTVTPYINSDGLVVMQIDESIDEISGATSITGVGNVPNTTSRRLSAEVAVHDGDSIVLGGFIRNSDNKQNSGIPILRDIPLLGPLFSSKSDAKERKELLVLMRPTVLRTPDLAALATEKEKKLLPGVTTAEAEVRLEEKKEILRERKEVRDLDKRSAAEDKKINVEQPWSTPQP